MAYWIRGRKITTGEPARMVSRTDTEDEARANARARGIEPESLELIVGTEDEEKRSRPRYEWGGAVFFALGLLPLAMAVFALVTGVALGKKGIVQEFEPIAFWVSVCVQFGLAVWFMWLGVVTFLRLGDDKPRSN